MARSMWIGTLIVVLASTRLALGQATGAPPTPAAGSGERIITVQEADGPAQKCRVVKSWTTSDGSPAMQVQAVDTGEMITVVGEGPAVPSGTGSRVRTMTTRIFHLGPSKTAPPGAPVPPPASVAQAPRPTPAPTPPAGRQPPANGMLAPKPAGPPPITASSGPRVWPPAHPSESDAATGRMTPSAPAAPVT